MKAVFFTLEPLLAEDEGSKESPAEIMEAFRELWAQGFFTALVGARPGERRSPEMERLQTLLEQGGGHIAARQYARRRGGYITRAADAPRPAATRQPGHQW